MLSNLGLVIRALSMIKLPIPTITLKEMIGVQVLTSFECVKNCKSPGEGKIFYKSFIILV